MKIAVKTIEGGSAGEIDLADAVFGAPVRKDILQRCVVWQLAKRQRGTHEVKNRAEIDRTGKKMYRQKGTGSARHGSARVNLFRGGGRSFGPMTEHVMNGTEWARVGTTLAVWMVLPLLLGTWRITRREIAG